MTDSTDNLSPDSPQLDRLTCQSNPAQKSTDSRQKIIVAGKATPADLGMALAYLEQASKLKAGDLEAELIEPKKASIREQLRGQSFNFPA